MKQVGNRIVHDGTDLKNSARAKGIMIRYIQDKRNSTGDPNWGGEGRTAQQVEARDFAKKAMAAVAKTSARLLALS